MTMFDPEISRSTRLVQIAGGFVVMAAFIGFIIYLSFGWNGAAKDAREAQKELISEIHKSDTLQDEYNKLYKEYTDATGKKPAAATPEEVQSTPGATGERGPKGDMGLPGQSVTGASGTPGTNGKDGINGANGADGKNGADGQPGQTGEKGDKGDPGASGSNGTNGVDGRGIQSISCDGDGMSSVWTITYTDGTSSTVAGPCRLALIP